MIHTIGLAFAFVPALIAGPQFNIFIGGGAGPSFCQQPRPFFCQPRPFCYPPYSPFAFSYGTPRSISYQSLVTPSFSNVSPVVVSGAPVLVVPAPVEINQPLTVYPQNSFRWKR